LEELSQRVSLLENLSAINNDLDLTNSQIKEATISGTLQVLGKTTVAELGVTGKITTGLLVIEGLSNETDETNESHETYASVSTLSGPLRLQDTALGNLEIMGGKVIIDTKGNISIQGKITVEEIETQKLKVNEGVTLKDQITGEDYCVKIENGEIKKSQGRCESPTP